jgi:hypothetical protein
MKTGTKSVLFGAHCFLLHPWFVAAAWWQLYGFPFDPRLWMAFIVHDIGYIGKPNMDGPEGERHPYRGAQIMGALFGERWYRFTLLHSRYLAKTLGSQPSRLCVADKLAIALTPAWLYLPMVRATGEVREYMAHAPHSSKGNEKLIRGRAFDGDGHESAARGTRCSVLLPAVGLRASVRPTRYLDERLATASRHARRCVAMTWFWFRRRRRARTR